MSISSKRREREKKKCGHKKYKACMNEVSFIKKLTSEWVNEWNEKEGIEKEFIALYGHGWSKE